MLTQICQYLRNWFAREKLFGTFKVENGVLTFADGEALPLLSNQYFRVVGSVFNDGVKQAGVDELQDEPAFDGAIWSMAIPQEIIDLDGEIENWISKNADAISSPYSSESFGGYSYTIRTNYSAASGSSQLSWQSVFGPQLSPWRKI